MNGTLENHGSWIVQIHTEVEKAVILDKIFELSFTDNHVIKIITFRNSADIIWEEIERLDRHLAPVSQLPSGCLAPEPIMPSCLMF